MQNPKFKTDKLLAVFITSNSENPACPHASKNGMMRVLGSLYNDPKHRKLERVLTRR
ncbi:MAG: hypothetical protein F6K62_08395 [Sphaerospermopsis sp. SIO1G2]|nr:hypothetical protein [Sphaerospermopsis sp. SIO1G2]